MGPCLLHPNSRHHCSMVIDWTPTLDVYHAKFGKDLIRALIPPLVARSHRKMTHKWQRWIVMPLCEFLDVPQNKLKNVTCHTTLCHNVPPCDLSCCNMQYIVYAHLPPTPFLRTPNPWLLIRHLLLIPCQVQVEAAHGPWYPSVHRGHRKRCQTRIM